MAEGFDDTFYSSPSSSKIKDGETNFPSSKAEEGSSKHCGQNEHESSLEEKLQELRRLCFEKRVEKKLLQKFIQNVQVAEFLNEHVFHPQYDDDDDAAHISQKQRKHIRQLLEEKEQLNERLLNVYKENRSLEIEVLNDKLYLKDCVKDRNYIWNKAAKIYEKKEGRNSDFEKLDATLGDLSVYDSTCQDNESVAVKYEIASKVSRISEVARVLHLLVSFSGVKWAYNSDLLEVVLCTGELLNNDFDTKNFSELKRIVDDVTHRLNHVKI